MGIAIMVGWLGGLIALVFWLVLHYDPEARATPAPRRPADEGAAR